MNSWLKEVRLVQFDLIEFKRKSNVDEVGSCKWTFKVLYQKRTSGLSKLSATWRWLNQGPSSSQLCSISNNSFKKMMV